MNNWWLRIGCFLTGYDFRIIRNCTEASKKAVKKYTSAFVIVCILWGFIGFTFVDRYLHSNILYSCLTAFVMIVIVIQIERQVILTIGKNKLAVTFRGIIAVVMAVIGSVIIDQIIFGEDVDKKKISTINEDVIKELPIRTKQLDTLIFQTDIEIQKKENDWSSISNEVNLQPTITIKSVKVTSRRDTTTDRMVPQDITVQEDPRPNPKIVDRDRLYEQLSYLKEKKDTLENKKLKIEDILRDEFKSKVGFLDDLAILFKILFSSPIAIIIWILWFVFLIAIELFVLINKTSEITHDYDCLILHQLNVRIEQLESLHKSNQY